MDGESIKTQDNTQAGQRPASAEITPNIMAAIAYIVPVVLGIVVLLMEKENKFVRFHAFQSIVFGIVWFAAASIATVLKILLIGFLLDPLVAVAGAALWIFLMWKAYSNEEYQLPIVGKIAHEQAYK